MADARIEATFAESGRQESAQRIGICLVDAEMFWWRADDGEPCPVCPLGDEDYERSHRFYIAETAR